MSMNPSRSTVLRVLLLAFLPLSTQAEPEWKDRSPHTSGFVTANGIKLHYLDWGGKGEVMLFLHGLGDTAHIFDDLAPKFSNSFRVLALTWRGHGQSDKPETGYDTATLVDDLRQFLDALKLERVILVGHSIAGDQLTRLAGEHPNRVSRLVYLDAAVDRASLPELMKDMPSGLSAGKGDLETLESFRSWIRRMSFWSEAWEANTREMMILSPEGKILREAKPGNVSRLLMQGTTTARPDYTRIKSPALSIAVRGLSSKVSDFVTTLPVERRTKMEDFIKRMTQYQHEQIERFRREIPNGRVIEFSNADHHCFIQREADVVREMRAFLAR
jgi:pimeloyl-ACP methyl ester carboxylesterase